MVGHYAITSAATAAWLMDQYSCVCALIVHVFCVDSYACVCEVSAHCCVCFVVCFASTRLLVRFVLAPLLVCECVSVCVCV
jgi:hypothetical protein